MTREQAEDPEILDLARQMGWVEDERGNWSKGPELVALEAAMGADLRNVFERESGE